MVVECYCCEKKVDKDYTTSCLFGRICELCADKVNRVSPGLSIPTPHCSSEDKRKFCGTLGRRYKAFVKLDLRWQGEGCKNSLDEHNAPASIAD